MLSFEELWSKMGAFQEQSPLLDSGEETKAMQAVRVGLGFENKNFWDDFIKLIQNQDAVGELLGVRPQDISRWGLRIKETLNKIKHHDEQPENIERRKNEMLPTGNSGAITV